MRLLAPFLLLVAALIITISLDRTPSEADLVFVNRGDVFTLDPQRQSYLQDFRMTYALYEGLVRWDNHDFTIEPAAAESWAVSENRQTWTFTLRPDARWSDGAAVTARDFAYSWMRLLLPETAADYSNLIFCIDGAEAFWHWRNDQLAAYGADPWSADDEGRERAARGLLRRFATLLDADDLPVEVPIDRDEQDRYGISFSSGLRRPSSNLGVIGTMKATPVRMPTGASMLTALLRSSSSSLRLMGAKKARIITPAPRYPMPATSPFRLAL